MQIFDALIDNLNFGVDIGGRYYLGNFSRNLLGGKWFVNLLHVVNNLLFGQVLLCFTFFVNSVYHLLHLVFLQQHNGSLKGHEVVESGHVDAITIRVSNLWSGRGYNNFFRAESVKDTDNTLLEGCSSYNRVVKYHQRILMLFNYTVSNIVHVSNQVVALVILGNEGSKFNVFHGNGVDPGTVL